MSKQFRPGLVYVFSTKKYKNDCRKDKDTSQYRWPKLINGRIVNIKSDTLAFYKGLYIEPQWCKCIGKENR